MLSSLYLHAFIFSACHTICPEQQLQTADTHKQINREPAQCLLVLWGGRWRGQSGLIHSGLCERLWGGQICERGTQSLWNGPPGALPQSIKFTHRCTQKEKASDKRTGRWKVSFTHQLSLTHSQCSVMVLCASRAQTLSGHVITCINCVVVRFSNGAIKQMWCPVHVLFCLTQSHSHYML